MFLCCNYILQKEVKIMKVIKRNDSEQIFDIEKIVNAIRKGKQ